MIKVLVIEDDINVSKVHAKFTEKVSGFEVVGIANDLDNALDMLVLLRPDLILLDIYFPTGSGLDFLRNIRREGNQADVILITAAREKNILDQALHGGAFDYLVKPVIFERFVQSLQRFQKYKAEIDDNKSMDQVDIDHIMNRHIDIAESSTDMPKGIDPITLRKIITIMEKKILGISAEEVGSCIGASRNTARRYLEYLVTTGTLAVDIDYGAVGRPEKKFIKIG